MLILSKQFWFVFKLFDKQLTAAARSRTSRARYSLDKLLQKKKQSTSIIDNEIDVFYIFNALGKEFKQEVILLNIFPNFIS